MDEIYAHLGGEPNRTPQQPMAPAPREPKSLESPVERAVKLVEEKIAMLEKSIAGLVDRLDPVLSPVAPQAPQAGAPKPASPQCSDLVRAISDRANALAALIARVESVTARVEL